MHHHRQVLQNIGSEMASVGVWGDEEYHGEDLLGLQQDAIICKILQVPEGFHYGIRLIFSVGGGEPAEFKEDLYAFVDILGKGGGESKGAKDVFQSIDAGSTDFWDRDVG